MKTYTTHTTSEYSPAVLALGCFDGIHKGHASVIKKACRIAEELDICASVWTFREPPKNFFLKNSSPVITTFDQKKELIENMGVDIFFCIDFNEEIKDTEAEDFLDKYILACLDVKHIVCGFNYRFGRGAVGDTEFLKKYCEKHGIGLSVLPPEMYGDDIVSSSLIRDMVKDGRVKEASALLGRNYSIKATVTEGQALARKLGFPTANQHPSEELLIPKYGVYISRSFIDGSYRYGITNIGMRPTVNSKRLCMETHYFDLSSDLYGRELSVEFIDFIREETKFSSVEKMAEQIKKDIEYTKSNI